MNNKNLSAGILFAAKVLWDYLKLDKQPEKSDCILALGSHDLRVAERAAELYLGNYAPLLIFSGGLGNFTRNIWDEPEAEKFAKVAIKMGVTSPQIDFDDYPNDKIKMPNLIHIMVGDLQRIMLYPKQGYQIAQEVPDKVKIAYDELINRGFTDHLIPRNVE